MSKLRLASIAAVATLTVPLSGCFFMGDPPPEPNVAPIEVVAKPDACLLNRDSVAAGTHDVAVIMQEGSGRVRIRRNDAVVFDKPMNDQVMVEEPSPLALVQGSYLVECVVNGRTSTATLTVTA